MSVPISEPAGRALIQCAERLHRLTWEIAETEAEIGGLRYAHRPAPHNPDSPDRVEAKIDCLGALLGALYRDAESATRRLWELVRAGVDRHTEPAD